MKLQPQVNQSGEVVGYCHWCEACESMHCFRIEHPFNANGPTWKFDGNMDSPSFHPSMRLFTGHKNSPNTVCHYFVKGGMIDYCNDSPHRLRGQKIELLHVDVVLAERQARYAHEALVDDRFRALVQLDLEWARKAMPGETGDEVRLVAMHQSALRERQGSALISGSSRAAGCVSAGSCARTCIPCSKATSSRRERERRIGEGEAATVSRGRRRRRSSSCASSYVPSPIRGRSMR
jgi:hypothetical protein